MGQSVGAKEGISIVEVISVSTGQKKNGGVSEDKYTRIGFKPCEVSLTVSKPARVLGHQNHS
ncbi:MAG: hypothetical protein CMM07_14925 [Rhodopirellula sp.]|nr:hypothetical protein [Rhodopirellula sp.]